MSGSVIKNVEDFNGRHNFLAEELLQPMTSKCDVSRTTMFCSHINQTVVLNSPERPRVYSGFENKFGSYTSAVRITPDHARIIAVFDKNPLQRVYALQYADGKMDVHFATPVRHLTENYGYRLDNSQMDGLEVGSEIEANQVIQGWPCTDAEGNFQFGANLRTVYMNLDGLTYEDGIIASASAAERLSHTSIEKITVVLNANDLTVNRYGDDEVHKGFPDVGEDIRSGVLLARRRINYDSILHDLSAPQLRQINWDADTVFYADGAVVDIDVFSNLSADALDKHQFNTQILAYHRRWEEFRAWFLETFKAAIVDGACTYTDDVGFWYRRCRDMGDTKWHHDRGEFDGIVIQFTIAKNNTLNVGSKITNRYGGKGVISAIRPDDQMPTTVDGKRADLVVNSLGVVNRLNPAQLYENELSFIADKVAAQMATMGPVEAFEHLMTFLEVASPKQAAWMRSNMTDPELVQEFVQEIASGREPIHIHQPPFFDTIPLDGMATLYAMFEVHKAQFEGIEEPMVLGTNYYMKLRHEPSSKLSARSAKHLSIAGVPTKNSRGVRTSTEHHSTTPIRLGEQELQNLLIANQPDELKRLLRLYATDDVSREGAIAELLLRPDAFSDAPVEARGSGMTRPVAGLTALLESVGLELNIHEDSYEQHEETLAAPDSPKSEDGGT